MRSVHDLARPLVRRPLLVVQLGELLGDEPAASAEALCRDALLVPLLVVVLDEAGDVDEANVDVCEVSRPNAPDAPSFLNVYTSAFVRLSRAALSIARPSKPGRGCFDRPPPV